MKDRLEKQLNFIIEIDKVKSVFRKTRLFDGSRRENDAEHAWHIAVMALIFSEYANEKGIDIYKVIKMLLIHDLVEIDAGDVAVYDLKARQNIKRKEEQAAARIFGLLPKDQSQELKALWHEFEARQSGEARFAAALDRMEPIIQNYLTKGRVWREMNISYDRVVKTNEYIRNGSEQLWQYVKSIIDESLAKGYLKRKPETRA